MSDIPHNLSTEQFWGKGFNHLFPEGSGPQASTPFPRAHRLKSHQDYDPDVVRKAMSKPHRLAEVDPRTLSSTQPMVTREGTRYYMGNEYNQTGNTFADQGQTGNEHPFVYMRSGYAESPPTAMLLAGHHRATAALLKGEPLRARIVEGPWGPPRRTT